MNEGRARNLFCFPPVLGYGVAYKILAGMLPDTTMVCFDYVEADSRLAVYVRCIEELQPEGPVVLFGFSSGGNLAWQVARALEEAGRVVSDVILLDSPRKMKAATPSRLEVMMFENFLKQEARHLMGDVSYAGSMFEKARHYFHHFKAEMVNEGQIHARLHLISLIRPRGRARRWQEASTEGCLTYPAHGWTHGALIQPKNMQKNAAVIRAILEDLPGAS